MTSLRHLIRSNRMSSAWLVVLALLMKLVVPTGFMLVVSASGLSIDLCTGYGPQKMGMAMPGMDHHQDKPDHQGKEMPCAFSGLAAPSLATMDSLPAIAIALAGVPIGMFRVASAERVSLPMFLRPPLRGPPVCA